MFYKLEPYLKPFPFNYVYSTPHIHTGQCLETDYGNGLPFWRIIRFFR
jgi:hypothetical protein